MPVAGAVAVVGVAAVRLVGPLHDPGSGGGVPVSGIQSDDTVPTHHAVGS